MKPYLLMYRDEGSAFNVYVLALVPAESLQDAVESIGGTLPFQQKQDGESGIVVVEKKHFAKLPLPGHAIQHVLQQEESKWGGYALPLPTTITLYLKTLPTIYGQIPIPL